MGSHGLYWSGVLVHNGSQLMDALKDRIDAWVLPVPWMKHNNQAWQSLFSIRINRGIHTQECQGIANLQCLALPTSTTAAEILPNFKMIS